MAAKKNNPLFFFLMPIIVVFGVGIFMATARRTVVSTACTPTSYSGLYLENEQAFFEQKTISLPPVAVADEEPLVLGLSTPSQRWVEVDLSEQKLRAWDGGSLFLETPVSTGLPWWPTPKGEFRIWVKLRYSKMEGGQGRYYYYLPNVPFVMYFENGQVPSWRGYSLHGTYWHNDFGNQHSHGCVNLPTPMAERLYYWTTPVLPDGKSSIFASPANPGTRIVIHD